jgi:hypothetical protein
MLRAAVLIRGEYANAIAVDTTTLVVHVCNSLHTDNGSNPELDKNFTINP